MANEKLIELKPAFSIFIQIWWSMLWRSMAWLVPVILGIFVISFVVGFASVLMGVKKESIESVKEIASLLGGIGGFLGGFWAYYKGFLGAIGKRFSGYKLVLLTPYGADTAEQADKTV